MSPVETPIDVVRLRRAKRPESAALPAFSDLPLRGHIRHEFATLSSSLLSMRFPQLIHYRPAVPPSNQPPTFPAPNRLSPLQTLLSLSPLLTLLVVARPFVVEWPIAIAVPDRFLVSAARWRARNPLSLSQRTAKANAPTICSTAHLTHGPRPLFSQNGRPRVFPRQPLEEASVRRI